jgi:Zn-dependent protease with chaperone function
MSAQRLVAKRPDSNYSVPKRCAVTDRAYSLSIQNQSLSKAGSPCRLLDFARRVTSATEVFLHTIVFMVVLLTASSAGAETPGRDMKKEAAIWAELQAVAPEAVAVFKQATTAMDDRNFKEAADLYKQVIDRRTRFDHAIRRLGLCLVEIGEVEEGLLRLGFALELNRSPENLGALAGVLARNDDVTKKYRALDLAKEAVAGPEVNPDDLALIAQLGLKLKEDAVFRDAAARLASEFPDFAPTHYFKAIQAAADEQWTEAEDEIRRAGDLGLPRDVVDAFLASGVQTHASHWRYTYYSLGLLGVWVLGLILLYAAGKILSSHTLKSIEKHKASADVAMAGDQQRSLRKAYSLLLSLAGSYYYLSLPVIAALLLALSCSVIYAFTMVGLLAFKLIVAVLCATIATISSMAQSIFIKTHDPNPGRALRKDEAPGLWALAEDVAASVGTRPIAEIRVTPGPENAVYERGTRREKARDTARRVLILGVGALNGLKVAPFQAVLAHEYGHFAHRDTAGGAGVLRASDDMVQFALAIASAGHARWWNLGFQFVRLYLQLFTRMSRGAARLQEALADRVAAAHYGPEAFEEGLRHVVRQSIELPRLINQETQRAVKYGGALRNVYNVTLADDLFPVDSAVEFRLKRPVSDNDTHPCGADRLLLIRNIRRQNNTLQRVGYVWDLFSNREALTAEMTQIIDASVVRYSTPRKASAGAP